MQGPHLFCPASSLSQAAPSVRWALTLPHIITPSCQPPLTTSTPHPAASWVFVSLRRAGALLLFPLYPQHPTPPHLTWL